MVGVSVSRRSARITRVVVPAIALIAAAMGCSDHRTQPTAINPTSGDTATVTTLTPRDVSPPANMIARVRTSSRVREVAGLIGSPLDLSKAQASAFGDHVNLVVPYTGNTEVFLFSSTTAGGKDIAFNMQFRNGKVRFFDATGGMEARLEMSGDKFRFVDMKVVDGRMGSLLDDVVGALGPRRAEASLSQWVCWASCMGEQCGLFTSCWWRWTQNCASCTWSILRRKVSVGACYDCINIIGEVGRSCYSRCF